MEIRRLDTYHGVTPSEFYPTDYSVTWENSLFKIIRE